MPSLPPELEELARPSRGALAPVTIRLPLEVLGDVENLRSQLNGPSRGALLRYLLLAGLRSTCELLQQGNG